MKILSYNIRGLGSRAKKKEIKKLIKMWCIDVCCIQEIKIDQVEARLGKSLWGLCMVLQRGYGEFWWTYHDMECRKVSKDKFLGH
ncbi:hypothetical protein ACS0TY_031739 [Phlomoides rotata]